MKPNVLISMRSSLLGIIAAREAAGEEDRWTSGDRTLGAKAHARSDRALADPSGY